MSTMRTFVCVISLVICAASLVYGVDHHRHISNGKSGVWCGTDNCLAHNESYCVDNKKCVCNPLFKNQIKGDGSIACYKKNKIYSYIRGEPQIVTYDEVKYDLNIPCRYMATHFESQMKIGKAIHGSCECEMYAWHAKHKGKMYPAGYDVACKIERFDGYENFDFSTRKHGIAYDGTYTHYANIALDYLPNGPWTNESHIDYHNHGLVVKCNYNDDNNMARNHIRACGFRVEFRPFDTKFGKNQRQVNGLAWGLSCANHPHLRSNRKTVSSAPEAHEGIPMEELLQNDGLPPELQLTPKEFMTFQALQAEVLQNQPDAAPECTAIQPVAWLCDTHIKKKRAANNCFWILGNQAFVKCYDKTNNGNDVMRLLKECFLYNCDDQFDCMDFVPILYNVPTNCGNRALKYREYIRGELCSRSPPSPPS